MICWRIVILLFSILSIVSCENPYKNEGSEWDEGWVATMNLDGSEINYLYKGSLPCFFITDLENPEQEKLLISGINSVGIMNIDGTDKHTIIPNIGNVVEISHDRTKMLMKYSGDIYLANVDGSDIMNLTDTEDINERHPSFSPDETKILYNYYYNINDSLRKRVIAYRDLTNNAEVEILSTEGIGYIGYGYPVFDDSLNVYFYKGNGITESSTGLYKTNIVGENISVITYGIIRNLVFNKSYYDIAFIKNRKFYSYSILDSEITNYEIDTGSLKPVFSFDGIFLALGSKAENVHLIIDWKTGSSNQLPVEFENPSFNKETTKIVCNIIRHYPGDFEK